MRWVQLYLLIGITVAFGWNNQVQIRCGYPLEFRGVVAAVAGGPLLLVLLFVWNEPGCKKPQ